MGRLSQEWVRLKVYVLFGGAVSWERGVQDTLDNEKRQQSTITVRRLHSILEFSPVDLACFSSFSQRKTKGGGKLRGGENIHKTPSQKRFWTPPTYDTFSLPACFRPVVFLRGNRHRPGESHFLRPPKLVLGRTLWYVFPPQNRTIRFAPPISRFPIFCTNLVRKPKRELRKILSLAPRKGTHHKFVGAPQWFRESPRTILWVHALSAVHQNRAIFAIAIANFHRRPEIAVISSAVFIEFFRGRPRGGATTLLLSFPSAPDPLFKASKAPFLTLRVATPSGAPCQAPLDLLKQGNVAI